MLTNNMCTSAERDRLAGYFLPENYHMRKELTRENLDSIVKTVLGTDDITKEVIWPSEENRVWAKEQDFLHINFSYSRIFELCRVIGAANLYDIGCQSINQAFLLMHYSTISYAGITNGSFFFNNFHPSDWDTNNYHVITTTQTPPPFCNGRIWFIKGHYPDFPLEVQPNNIAIACYSFTMCREEEQITRISAALSQDFDRILFNTGSGWINPKRNEMWKKQDWHDFEMYPIGPEGFVFGTKNPEDIRRMKETYPFENGRFITGIDDGLNYLQCQIPSDPFEDYADWN